MVKEVEENNIELTNEEKKMAVIFKGFEEWMHDDNVTNIDWNGYDLWITHLEEGRTLKDTKFDRKQITNLALRLSDVMHLEFNPAHPVLEADVGDRRVSIYHESICQEVSISIRHSPKFARLKRNEIIKNGYVSEKLLNLIENCVLACMNIVIWGMPQVGKTELLKYLTQFIAPNARAISIEDNREIHYRYINPNKDSVSLTVNQFFDYSKAISSMLRHNTVWTLLSESRGKEVLELFNSLSTGTYTITTGHTFDVRYGGERFMDMIGESSVSPRYINKIYEYMDVGILIENDVDTQKRQITQTCFYAREERDNELQNIVQMVYENGEFFETNTLPKKIQKKFSSAKIKDIFEDNSERRTN